MVGCALAAWVGNWMYYSAWPSGPGRGWLVVPFLPLTALAVLLAGVHWTRRIRASTAEAIASLLLLEVIVLVIVSVVAMEWFTETEFLFWAVISLAFAPWWLLAIWIGRATRHRRHD